MAADRGSHTRNPFVAVADWDAKTAWRRRYGTDFRIVIVHEVVADCRITGFGSNHTVLQLIPAGIENANNVRTAATRKVVLMC